MKVRGKNDTNLPPNNSEAADCTPEPEVKRPRRCCCGIQDAATKFGSVIFGILLTGAGVALLFFGFRPEVTGTGSTKGSKVMVTTGFIGVMLGLFLFVVGILLFKNISSVYPENRIRRESQNTAL